MNLNIVALREKIFNAEDIKFEDVTVPEWGGITIRCKTMSARQRAAWIDRASDKSGNMKSEAMYDMLITNCFDPESGEAIFEPADRDMLLDKSGKAVGLLQESIFRLSGLSDKAVEQVKND